MGYKYFNKNKLAMLSNQQLYDKNQDALNRQEGYLDEILENNDQIQQTGNEINTEIKDQNKLLDKLGEKTDKNLNKMSKTKKKLDDILKNSSYWKLYLVIIVEV